MITAKQHKLEPYEHQPFSLSYQLYYSLKVKRQVSCVHMDLMYGMLLILSNIPLTEEKKLLFERFKKKGKGKKEYRTFLCF